MTDFYGSSRFSAELCMLSSAFSLVGFGVIEPETKNPSIAAGVFLATHSVRGVALADEPVLS
ncbi:hypothetical protein LRS11_17745 [Pseudomonas sp. J452]|uniref:hypothetical protein n=1 Tax=Pseudomonas sp. J452 TaxID=2898441 RepID=UPI0021AE1E28|nr:hypothetical protein [Pseudomonas sp. J452]UUY07648.1 hypothetical protein LRS11_17745 [Pseudomonas sp. J452]